jgi:predicted DNA-binding protein
MQTKFTKPTQCRFHPRTERKLKELSERFGVRPASLIRIAVDSQLSEIESSGQIIINKRSAS